MMQRRIRKLSPRAIKRSTGIALFILMTSLIVLSLIMKELVQSAASSAERVKNLSDRLQALYLAKSQLNIYRFLILLDRGTEAINPAGAADTPLDQWNLALPFPIDATLLHEAGSAAFEVTGGSDSDSSAESSRSTSTATDTDEGVMQKETKKSLVQKCNSFFDDFDGESSTEVTDLSSMLNLNDLSVKRDDSTLQRNMDLLILINMLSQERYITEHLQSQNLTPETLAEQIRDYLDIDFEILESKAPESSIYTNKPGEVQAKNTPLTVMDEIRNVPGMDDEIFDYLSDKASVQLLRGNSGGRFNLNTVNKSVFAALLKDTSNPEDVASRFVKDRTEKARVYVGTDSTKLGQQLQDNIGLPSNNIYLSLLTGKSDGFKIVTEATVRQTQVRLETIVNRNLSGQKIEPIERVRISP